MTEPETPGEPPRQSSPADVLERVTDAVFALDEDWRFTYFNDRAEAMFQRDQADLRGKVIWEEFPVITDSMFQWESERALETQESATFEMHYSPQDGWFKVRVYPSETGVSVYVRDITEPDDRQQELKEREQALRRAYEVIASDRPFSQQINSLLEVVRTTIGTDYATLSHVQDAEYLFEAVASPDDADLQAGDRVPLTATNCERVVETERTLVLNDVDADAPELADRAGNAEWGISCYLGAPVMVGSEVYGSFCFYGMETRTEEFSDWEVTFVNLLSNWVSNELERKAYERELEESNEELEQFAYAASHDLQEPLRMVTSYLQLIERRYADELDEDGEEFIDFAVDGADRMRDMIEGLLEYSRVDTHGDPFEPVDLDDILADVRDDLQMTIVESNAEITTESLPRVDGDEGQLRQVFQNLLDNAIEYSGDESPQVHVSAERDGNEWMISVSDDGIGIDPEDKEHVFEVFQSLHTNDEHPGMGIGLALCERIIERHGGDIWVDSEPGEGATFTFTLPADGP